MPTEKTKQKALQALDGMAEIVKNEMVTKGLYLNPDVDIEKKNSGAICGGHKACAIGSLWLGYGIKPKRDEWGDLILPGVYEEQRGKFLAGRPGLRLALNALNGVAERYIARNGIEDEETFKAPIESLFESSYSTSQLTREDLLGVINRAKAKVRRVA